jgi:ATP-dependent DNA ligase
MSHFPTLHGEGVLGKTKVWTISVEERDVSGVIVISRGYLDGKMQVSEKVISQGKNIGKKNETTPVQQAISEARASWIKMKESGYSEAIKEQIDNTASVRGKGIAADVPLPMLAHEYHKRGKGFPFPCFTQPKLDGTRCVGIPGKGLFSRLRKTIPHMEHIIAELNRLPPDLILDGELYTNELTFQEIVGLVKRETLKDGDLEKQQKIKYHVYDLIQGDSYEQRHRGLQTLFASFSFQHLILVPTFHCGSEAEMKEQHARFVADGYEGIMLRNPAGVYKNVRSVDLLKYKEFFDDEYEVVGFKEGEGAEKGCVLWTCKTENGATFHCRPRGTREDRTELYQKGASYIGKKLTVRFQELTDDGIPRFPVGIAFRDYE